MNDKASLLGQLRIDRDGAPEPSSWKLWAGGAAALAVIAGGLWFALAPPSGIPVKVAVVKPAPTGAGPSQGASLLDASGYVVAQRQAAVSGKSIYKVTEILVTEGQHVKANEVIARLDDSNARAVLEQAKAQVRASEASAAAAALALNDIKPIYQRNQELLKAGWISQGAFDSSKAAYNAAEAGLEVARRQQEVALGARDVAQRFEDDTVVRAPFNGVVTVKSAQPGQIVSPQFQGGGGIATIVDMDSLEVEVDVSEAFISRVHPGQAAIIKLNAYPDWQIPGELVAVIPTADRAKATVKVRVGFKEKDERVVPEMGARVSFLDDAPAAAQGGTGTKPVAAGTIVPAEAVQATGDTGVVFVIRDKQVERRAVRLGGKSPDGQVVLSGISAGDKLAVGDFAQLADGARIRIE